MEGPSRVPSANPSWHTYMVADPDPDGSDFFQIAVGFLEQVTHQLIQATLDCHLGAERSDSIGAKRGQECDTYQLSPATLPLVVKLEQGPRGQRLSAAKSCGGTGGGRGMCAGRLTLRL